MTIGTIDGQDFDEITADGEPVEAVTNNGVLVHPVMMTPIDITDELLGTLVGSTFDETRNEFLLATRRDSTTVELYSSDMDGNVSLEHTITGFDASTDRGTLESMSNGDLFLTTGDRNDGGLIKSTDGGETWTEVIGEHVRTLTYDSGRDIIYAALYAEEIDPSVDHVQKSADGGDSWTGVWNPEEWDDLEDDFHFDPDNWGNGFDHIHCAYFDDVNDALYVSGGDFDQNPDSDDYVGFGTIRADGEPSETSDFTWIEDEGQYTDYMRLGDYIYVGDDTYTNSDVKLWRFDDDGGDSITRDIILDETNRGDTEQAGHIFFFNRLKTTDDTEILQLPESYAEGNGGNPYGGTILYADPNNWYQVDGITYETAGRDDVMHNIPLDVDTMDATIVGDLYSGLFIIKNIDLTAGYSIDGKAP